MPKMPEFIEELQEKLGLYGDHDVVMAADESDPSVDFDEETDPPAFVIE